MVKSHLILLLLVCLNCTTTKTLSQSSQAPSPSPLPSSPPPPTPPLPSPLPSPPAPAPLSTVTLSPAPPGPTDIVAILTKAGSFSALIRLLKTTQVDDRISSLLSDSKVGLTLFAPTDKAFSNLKPGTLNSLTDRQQVQLVLFHILTSYYPTSQFEAASNPLHTQAGDVSAGEYPLNVTTPGKNQITLMTGLVNTTVSKEIFSDGQLAVYQVDDVLLPMRIFAPQPPAPAPSKTKKPGTLGIDANTTTTPSGSSDSTSVTSSGALALVVSGYHLAGALAVVAAAVSLW